MPQRAFQIQHNIRHALLRKGLPKIFRHLKPSLQLAQHKLRFRGTHPKSGFQHLCVLFRQAQRPGIKISSLQIPRTQIPGRRNHPLPNQLKRHPFTLTVNPHLFLLSKLHSRMPDQALQQLQKLRLLKIHHARCLTRKQFLQYSPQFLVIRVHPIPLLRQCRKQSLLPLQNSPKPNHHLTPLPCRLNIQRQHHMHLQFSPLLGNLRPAIRHRRDWLSWRVLRVDHFQSQRNDMRTNPPIFTNHQAGALVFHVRLGNNLHRDLLHLSSHPQFTRKHPVFIMSRFHATLPMNPARLLHLHVPAGIHQKISAQFQMAHGAEPISFARRCTGNLTNRVKGDYLFRS